MVILRIITGKDWLCSRTWPTGWGVEDSRIRFPNPSCPLVERPNVYNLPESRQGWDMQSYKGAFEGMVCTRIFHPKEPKRLISSHLIEWVLLCDYRHRQLMRLFQVGEHVWKYHFFYFFSETIEWTRLSRKYRTTNQSEEHISKEDFQLPWTVREAPLPSTEAKLPSIRLSPSEEVAWEKHDFVKREQKKGKKGTKRK